MKNLFLILILLPTLSFAQFEEDSLLIGRTMFSIPSPTLALQVLNNHSKFDDSVFVLNYKKCLHRNANSLRSGFLATQLSYAVLFDSSRIDSSILRMNDFGLRSDFQTPDLSNIKPELRSSCPDSSLIKLMTSYHNWSSELINNGDYSSPDLFTIGGWIESMYLLSIKAIEEKDESIILRISEQKSSVDQIINRLEEIRNVGKFAEIIVEMKKLQMIYDSIKTKYEYKEPISNTETRTTTFGSTTEVSTPKGTMELINERLSIIRMIIMN